jgi:hypothetical protein
MKLIEDDVSDADQIRVFDRCYDQTRGQVNGPVWDQLWDRVFVPVRLQVGRNVWAIVFTQSTDHATPIT